MNSESEQGEELPCVIDLFPKTEEQKEIYREVLKIEFNKKYLTQTGFSEVWTGFDFVKEKIRLDDTLKSTKERKIILSFIQKKIKKYFDYPACIEKEFDESNPITKKINKQLNNEGYDPVNMPHWFANSVIAHQ